jgi:fructose-1,6-bisphosphatase/inositol monophosphatase family enzyme
VLDEVGDLIREVAATVVLPRFRRLDDDDVQVKAPGDLVTVADQEAEVALTAGLTALLPGSLVLGEEAVAADPDVLRRVDDQGAVWIVDPVDGTNNFAAGKTPFAVMVALVRGGEPAASWILAAAHSHLLGEVTAGHHCAGYEYPAVATDEQQFALFWRVLPWDHVPGSLFLREAGGTVLHLDGSPYHPADSERGLLVAPNDDVWHSVRDTLFPGVAF